MRTKRKPQKLPAPTGAPRIETGPVQFGDDWPGMFIRGDDAMTVLAAIKTAAGLSSHDAVLRTALAPLLVLVDAIEKDGSVSV